MTKLKNWISKVANSLLGTIIEVLGAKPEPKVPEAMQIAMRSPAAETVLDLMGENRQVPFWEKEAPRIKVHEGFRDAVYLDSLGYPTIGYGHLLPKGKFKAGDRPYTKEQLQEIFYKDLESHGRIAEKFVPKNAPEEVKKIVANMAFNLGENKLAGFKNMLAAIQAGDYNRAADEMVDSRWYKQVGNRSKELEARMRQLARSNSATV